MIQSSKKKNRSRLKGGISWPIAKSFWFEVWVAFSVQEIAPPDAMVVLPPGLVPGCKSWVGQLQVVAAWNNSAPFSVQMFESTIQGQRARPKPRSFSRHFARGWGLVDGVELLADQVLTPSIARPMKIQNLGSPKRPSLLRQAGYHCGTVGYVPTCTVPTHKADES